MTCIAVNAGRSQGKAGSDSESDRPRVEERDPSGFRFPKIAAKTISGMVRSGYGRRTIIRFLRPGALAGVAVVRNADVKAPTSPVVGCGSQTMLLGSAASMMKSLPE